MTNGTSAASICCSVLSSLLSGKVFGTGSDAYASSLSSYFSLQQAEVQPFCVVLPETAQDVSEAVHALTSTDSPGHGCEFAVRSGGYSYYAGASNIQGGVTIDLQGLNHINVEPDGSIVSVGAGATWVSVYSYLDPMNLTVNGGRTANVGVGGLTLGGGISYLGPRYGWTCDTVQSYEVVLANGTIASANNNENPDLFWALHGGSNNFGIVTRVDFQAIEQDGLWGGIVYHALSTGDEHIAAFVDFSQPESYDVYSSLITTFSYSNSGSGGIYTVATNMEYTKPVANPPVFHSVSSIPSLASTMRITNMTDLSSETQSLQQPGFRDTSASLTFEPTVEALNAIVQAWNDSVPAIQDVPGIVFSVVMDPLPPQFYAHNIGGNALGFEDRQEKPLAILLVSPTWSEEKDDIKVEAAAKALTITISEELGKLGVLDPFIYLNYAARWQDPIPGYGRSTVERLERIQRKYDPAEVFTKQVPGGFKIDI